MFEKVFNNGIIKTKDSFFKLLKVYPINYNLKSSLEKEAILNSYRLFLKTCNFDIQILIQTNKENINKNIDYIKKVSKEDFPEIKKIVNKYNKYLLEINNKNENTSKKFFILIKINPENLKNNKIEFIREELNSNYLKIKECLARCGNKINEINSEEETKMIIYSFFNNKMYKNFLK